MPCSRHTFLIGSASALCLLISRPLAGQAPDLAQKGHTFSLPLTVEGLPEGAESVPVSTAIDFTDMLARIGVSGIVDERSLRLYPMAGGDQLPEEPVQFLPFAQPRLPARTLAPGTPASVSYLGEHASDSMPQGLKVAGELTWLARADGAGRAEYRLDFAIPRNARAIQAPFPPQNMRMFDGEGRATPVHWFPRMQIRPQWPVEGVLNVLEANQLLTSLHVGPSIEGRAAASVRRPFLYPLNGPDGIPLTEFGKPHDPTGSHAHHYSLWIAHSNVAGKDFWSEKGGKIAHDQFELLEDGPIFCRIVQKTRWIDEGVALLLERRDFTFYQAAADFRLIDLDLQFTPAGSGEVTFGRTTFGFLACRVAQSMTVFDGGGEILNALGDRNEPQAHLKHAAWIDQSGPIGPEKWNGIALFDHPENINHPTGWHCRNDGWVGAAFNMDAPYVLATGKTLRLRYRICLHRQNALKGQVAQRYAEYAARMLVHLGAPIAR